MEKIHKNAHVLSILNTKAHACFRANFSFSTYFYPPLHHNGKGSIHPAEAYRQPVPLVQAGCILQHVVTDSGGAHKVGAQPGVERGR